MNKEKMTIHRALAELKLSTTESKRRFLKPSSVVVISTVTRRLTESLLMTTLPKQGLLMKASMT